MHEIESVTMRKPIYPSAYDHGREIRTDEMTASTACLYPDVQSSMYNSQCTSVSLKAGVYQSVDYQTTASRSATKDPWTSNEVTHRVAAVFCG